MGEWIRHRGSKSMPKRLEGMRFAAKLRDGSVHVVSSDSDYLRTRFAWVHKGHMDEIMQYSIIGKIDEKPDTDGWIEWYGGECPVAKGTLVDVKFRNGRIEDGTPAGEDNGGYSRMQAIDWSHHGFQSDIIAYRLSKPDWPEDRIDVIGQNGNDGLHYDIEQNPSPEVIEKLQQLASNAEDAFERGKQSGGGKLPITSYYHVHIDEPASKELAPYTAECADIIEALNMTFNEGEAFKAIWRMASARMGNGKEGNNQLYDADKIAHYGSRIAAMARRK